MRPACVLINKTGAIYRAHTLEGVARYAPTSRDHLLKRGRDVRCPMSRRRGRPRSHVSTRDPMSRLRAITHKPVTPTISIEKPTKTIELETDETVAPVSVNEPVVLRGFDRQQKSLPSGEEYITTILR